MPNATANDIEGIRERIRNPDPEKEGITPDDYAEDRELLLETSKIMGRYRSEWGHERHLSTLKRLIILSWGGTDTQGYSEEELHDASLSAALEDREATGEIVEWIHDTYANEETNRDMRGALRTFGKILTNDDPTGKEASPPPSIDWVSATVSGNYDPVPKAADMITWTETHQMCEHPKTNVRDAAIIATAWDAGLRSGELEDLKVRDVSDHELGMVVRVDGKTGEREVTVTNAVPYIQQWLNAHPAPDDLEAPLWSKLKSPEEISYRMFRNIFKNAAERISLDKPNDPTNFRKSSVSDLASRVSQSHLERRYGWERGSNSASRYIRIFGEDADRELAEARGMDIEVGSEDEDEGPGECWRCDSLVNAEEDTCYSCGASQSRENAVQKVSTGTGLIERIREVVREEIENHDFGPDPRVSSMGEITEIEQLRAQLATDQVGPTSLEELSEKTENVD